MAAARRRRRGGDAIREDGGPGRGRRRVRVATPPTDHPGSAPRPPPRRSYGYFQFTVDYPVGATPSLLLYYDGFGDWVRNVWTAGESRAGRAASLALQEDDDATIADAAKTGKTTPPLPTLRKRSRRQVAAPPRGRHVDIPRSTFDLEWMSPRLSSRTRRCSERKARASIEVDLTQEGEYLKSLTVDDLGRVRKARGQLWLRTSRSTWFFAVLANCADACPREQGYHNCQGPLVIPHYEMHFTNGAETDRKEFSADQIGTLEIAIVFFCLSAGRAATVSLCLSVEETTPRGIGTGLRLVARDASFPPPRTVTESGFVSSGDGRQPSDAASGNGLRLCRARSRGRRFPAIGTGLRVSPSRRRRREGPI